MARVYHTGGRGEKHIGLTKIVFNEPRQTLHISTAFPRRLTRFIQNGVPTGDGSLWFGAEGPKDLLFSSDTEKPTIITRDRGSLAFHVEKSDTHEMTIRPLRGRQPGMRPIKLPVAATKWYFSRS